MKVCFYSWFGDSFPELSWFKHNEIVTLKDESEMWDLIKKIYDAGLHFSVKNMETSVLVCVSRKGFGQRG